MAAASTSFVLRSRAVCIQTIRVGGWKLSVSRADWTFPPRVTVPRCHSNDRFSFVEMMDPAFTDAESAVPLFKTNETFWVGLALRPGVPEVRVRFLARGGSETDRM